MHKLGQKIKGSSMIKICQRKSKYKRNKFKDTNGFRFQIRFRWLVCIFCSSQILFLFLSSFVLSLILLFVIFFICFVLILVILCWCISLFSQASIRSLLRTSIKKSVTAISANAYRSKTKPVCSAASIISPHQRFIWREKVENSSKNRLIVTIIIITWKIYRWTHTHHKCCITIIIIIFTHQIQAAICLAAA